ncbi:GntR family transcriptional regulator [Ktedonobacter sp. SOSP1-52]|uniref:MocR-like pyridoxine biosynthesis transcription factor PdxR n=1 Tax=Ktedonobacter sp. SOSP1-52 TaxID=2778366 RepID=UPI0019150DC3|nr:PLP-dependent aminotransferase family protein [Ktedonobacter sp. SOSP1-52]GHO63805.1 GntR family transcriptional regulator [Ktedonobacter sp. SOSP1-52]
MRASLDLPITLDREHEQSLHVQLAQQVRKAIVDGLLSAGTQLPSTRALAAALTVSRNVIVAAYDELFAEGYLEGRRGSGTYVSQDLPSRPHSSRPSPSPSPRWVRPTTLPVSHPPSSEPNMIEFRLGTPTIAPLSTRVWHEIWRKALANLPPNMCGSPNGDPRLRTALAEYLGRARGIVCQANDLIVTSGATQALDLLARAILEPKDLVGFEEPGYPTARHILAACGAKILPLPVDDDGVRVDQLPNGPGAPVLVHVTPSHQYPLTTRLSVARRLALLDWAQANDSLIIEDDYDSEFRFHAPPLPALASLDTSGYVAYIGTFSKVLTPALRVGYMLVPPPLRESIERLKRFSDYHTSWPTQQALAILLSGGHLDRHIRRMRLHYAQKRQVLKDILAPIAHLAQLRGLDAGLHVYLELRADLDSSRVAQKAKARGILISTIDTCYAGTSDRNGLLLGYGGLPLEDVVRGTQILREVLEQLEVKITSTSKKESIP